MTDEQIMFTSSCLSLYSIVLFLVCIIFQLTLSRETQDLPHRRRRGIFVFRETDRYVMIRFRRASFVFGSPGYFATRTRV